MSRLFHIYAIQMGQLFSHYALRSLLVLYLIKEVQISEFRALSVNGFICSLIALSGILGGVIADRYLGLKRSISWGAILMSGGYISLIFPPFFFAGLALITVGSSLFTGNILALCGLASNKPQEGFTRLYALQNLSALTGVITCAAISEHYGFRSAFALAATGVVISHALVYFLPKHLEQKEPSAPSTIKPALLLALFYAIALLGCINAHLTLPLLPFLTCAVFAGCLFYLIKSPYIARSQLLLLLIRFSALILFFVAEDQTLSSLILLTEHGVDRMIAGYTIPSGFITGLNPIVIGLVGLFALRKSPSPFWPLTLTAAAFGALAILCSHSSIVPLAGLVGTVVVISMSELMLGPAAYTQAFQLAPKATQGLIMGMVRVCSALAFQLSGLLGRFFFADAKEQPSAYTPGFTTISLTLAATAILLHWLFTRSQVKIEAKE